jgi:triphosphoribosyl-dephospho-CoA synthase
VQATRRVAPANTNLGIALLLAPLAKAGSELLATNYQSPIPTADLRNQLRAVLNALTVADAIHAYAAIRLAMPGGLAQRVSQHDVRDEPAVTLREAMAAAAGRDSIAAEYAGDYALTFERALPALQAAWNRGLPTRPAVVQAYAELLAAVPDTLIARKRGREVAEAVSQGAAQALAAGGMYSAEGREAIAAFDADVRDADNSLNPGTTADLIAAALFVALLAGQAAPIRTDLR